MGTAVEAVVIRVVRDGMAMRGRNEKEIEEVMSQGWSKVYNQDLLDLLGIPVGQGGRFHSRWWAEHYPRRNEAVHSGARIPQNEAISAISDTYGLIDWIGSRLRETPDLAPMGPGHGIPARGPKRPGPA